MGCVVVALHLRSFLVRCDALELLDFDFEAPQELCRFHVAAPLRSTFLQPEGLWLKDLSVETSQPGLTLDLSECNLTKLRLQAPPVTMRSALISFGRLQRRRVEDLTLDLVGHTNDARSELQDARIDLKGFSQLKQLSLRSGVMLTLPEALELQELSLEVPSLEDLDLSEWAVYGSLQ
eukprot:symbB.v1.2.020798.t1/scaffold1769.1/size102324/8